MIKLNEDENNENEIENIANIHEKILNILNVYIYLYLL